MRTIANYYDLLLLFENSNYRIEWLKEDLTRTKEYEIELDKNNELRMQIEVLDIELNEPTEVAEKVRLGIVHITNKILESLGQIETWGSYHPDLNQGMIIPGYLFGSILDDYRTNLITEGDYYPAASIYMSRDEWPSGKLKNLLLGIKEDLANQNFRTKKEGVDYFEHIRRLFGQILNELRQLGYV